MKLIDVKPVESKRCGACTLCCKLYDVDWLDAPKPAGKWCHHCKPGVGCAIWQELPKGCGDYFCVWRMDPDMGEEWRPDRARFILSQQHPDQPLTVVADLSAPNAHQREPYRTRLAQTARSILQARGSTIVVFRGKKRSLLFPDCEIDVPDGLPLNEVIIDHFTGPNGKFWRPRFPKAA